MSYARGWTDTHCHIHDDKMAFASHESLTRAREAGVERFVVIGCDAETCTQALSIANSNDDVWATIGLHPHDATQGVDSVVPFIDSPRVVGIGECGLDYYYEHSPRDVQMRAFAEQIALAHQHNLTLVIHTRDAWHSEQHHHSLLHGRARRSTRMRQPRRVPIVQRNCHFQERGGTS